MDISTTIEYIVLATVVIILIHLFKYLYLDLFIYFIQVPLIGTESIFFPQPLSSFFRSFFSIIVNLTTIPLLYIIVFYLLFYGIYLLIQWILDQGWLFFIHPLVSPLLGAPPFKQLIKFGVFRLIKGVFAAFGISTIFGAFIKFYVSVYIFSNENIKYIFNLIAPNLGDKILDYINKNKGKTAKMVESDINKEQEEIKNKQEEEDNKPRNQIETSVNVAVSHKLKPITPDLDATDKNNIFISNNNKYINEYSKKIGDYIKLNY